MDKARKKQQKFENQYHPKGTQKSILRIKTAIERVFLLTLTTKTD